MPAESLVPNPALATLEQKLDQLPLLPAVVTELLSLDPEADDYFNRLLRLAERDPPFAVRVLRCANSAYSAPRFPIVSLDEAFNRLGTEQCAGLVLALSVIKVFAPRNAGQKSLWVHSLQTAMFARLFSRWVRATRVGGNEAYLCGLLHDIGRFVQFEGNVDELDRVNDLEWASPDELVRVEYRELGYDHALLGFDACRKWALPESIAEVVRRHHEKLPVTPVADDWMIKVVQWADILSVTLMANPAMAEGSEEELAAWLASEHPRLGPADEGSGRSWRVQAAALNTESRRILHELRVL
jgi:putative nucleotidyltransferase with HDIG domain